jgi:hypothetical protein
MDKYLLPIEKVGQHYVTNHFNCGGCQKIVNFERWTTAGEAETKIVDYGWFKSEELGWVCPNCLFNFFEYLTEQLPWYVNNFSS